MFILHVTVSTRVTVPVSPRLPLLARTTTPVGCAAVPEGMAQQTNVYSKQSTIYPAVIAGSSAAARTPAAAVYCPTYIEKLDALAAAGPVAGTTLTNMTRKQQTEPKPCLSRLLSHLRDPAELRKLLDGMPESDRHDGSDKYLAPHHLVNRLAYYFSPEGLANGDTAVEEAMEAFTDAARTREKDHFLSSKTRHNVPLLYYAVASGSTTIVRFLLDHGATKQLQPDYVSPLYKLSVEVPPAYIPVVAIAVALQDHDMVHLLLKRGANPLGVPTALYLQDMLAAGYHAMAQPDSDAASRAAAWCRTEEDEKVLRSGINMLMQYWLARALKLPALSDRCIMITEATQTQCLSEMRMAVIGQEIACSMLYTQLLLHFGMSNPHSQSRQPLVLLLAGPSGHGKTLAGEMLQSMIPSAAFHIEDCAKLHHVVDLWGAVGCFQNSENRPTFAAFLSANSGRPCIVVLDEYEKATQQVHNSFLKVFQDGDFIDIYQQARYNCSQAIFLLTTNAADSEILNYWANHKQQLLNISTRLSGIQHKLQPLTSAIKAAMAGRTSRSLTSRLKGVVPFFPFTPCEQSMVVHKALLDIKADLAKPPHKEQHRFHGNLQLELHDQLQVCRKLAKDAYDESEGARTVRNAISTEVELRLKLEWVEEKYSNGDTAVLAKADEPDSLYDLKYYKHVKVDELMQY